MAVTGAALELEPLLSRQSAKEARYLQVLKTRQMRDLNDNAHRLSIQKKDIVVNRVIVDSMMNPTGPSDDSKPRTGDQKLDEFRTKEQQLLDEKKKKQDEKDQKVVDYWENLKKQEREIIERKRNKWESTRAKVTNMQMEDKSVYEGNRADYFQHKTKRMENADHAVEAKTGYYQNKLAQQDQKRKDAKNAWDRTCDQMKKESVKKMEDTIEDVNKRLTEKEMTKRMMMEEQKKVNSQNFDKVLHHADEVTRRENDYRAHKVYSREEKLRRIEAQQQARSEQVQRIAKSREEYRRYVAMNHEKHLQKEAEYREALRQKVEQDKQIFELRQSKKELCQKSIHQNRLLADKTRHSTSLAARSAVYYSKEVDQIVKTHSEIAAHSNLPTAPKPPTLELPLSPKGELLSIKSNAKRVQSLKHFESIFAPQEIPPDRPQTVRERLPLTPTNEKLQWRSKTRPNSGRSDISSRASTPYGRSPMMHRNMTSFPRNRSQSPVRGRLSPNASVKGTGSPGSGSSRPNSSRLNSHMKPKKGLSPKNPGKDSEQDLNASPSPASQSETKITMRTISMPGQPDSAHDENTKV